MTKLSTLAVTIVLALLANALPSLAQIQNFDSSKFQSCKSESWQQCPKCCDTVEAECSTYIRTPADTRPPGGQTCGYMTYACKATCPGQPGPR